MSKSKLFGAAAILLAASLVPSLSEARVRHRHHHYNAHAIQLPYGISYLHNYGPGAVPGTFAYYDGPSTNHCYQGAANYIGQDGRRHPCF
ncbi:MAG: hypothetical protein HY852_14460 [Bradyrhizobium sp.]|uniref:hypothetical protein n=1 Tax=Bradyrhizobium sp. TaxID=376 RepID=UPI0025BE73F3|nr:hypothetical protein [Bradyrhizobium sp.]MBI5263010.1 hypothetical protein [Bradyrhizobium sp.]